MRSFKVKEIIAKFKNWKDIVTLPGLSAGGLRLFRFELPLLKV